MTGFQANPEFLTAEECAEVDKALMTSRDRFSTRVAIYALRSLKQMSQETGLDIAQIAPDQIRSWVRQDKSLQQTIDVDDSFLTFFTQLVLSSLKPLKRIAEANGEPIANLTPPQVIAWFEQAAKARLESV